jgi:hypothetical protein
MAGVLLSTIRDALATRIDGVTGVRAFGRMPGNIPTSSEANTAVIVMPDPDQYVSYWEAFKGGCAEVRFRLLIICQLADFPAAQKRVDELMSAGTGSTMSLLDAVQADRTLGGTVADAHVGEGQYTGEQEGWLAAHMTVRCVMRREA